MLLFSDPLWPQPRVSPTQKCRWAFLYGAQRCTRGRFARSGVASGGAGRILGGAKGRAHAFISSLPALVFDCLDGAGPLILQNI